MNVATLNKFHTGSGADPDIFKRGEGGHSYFKREKTKGDMITYSACSLLQQRPIWVIA